MIFCRHINYELVFYLLDISHLNEIVITTFIYKTDMHLDNLDSVTTLQTTNFFSLCVILIMFINFASIVEKS